MGKKEGSFAIEMIVFLFHFLQINNLILLVYEVEDILGSKIKKGVRIIESKKKHVFNNFVSRSLLDICRKLYI